ncbi:RNA polymerase sigma factor [Pedobacter sp. Leaf176]|uniref:RNA polymerase sigma factor n=1 Tax=Pedobacter sp. Leaf176 TaxID=1736286 RepID=UPI0006FB4659|nr:sigma-70 family RNA polymerase sigma factor [Pedobacter sp. Leaf176]KQR66909.1 RNA polymerase subunit sigma-24 [Pedobacter sp. Leaf176]
MDANRNSENDVYLFNLLREGDEGAFSKIYKLHWAELYNAAYKRLPEKEKCQDVIQNVFADLWNRKGELDLQKPLAYLHTAVRFQVLKHLYKNSRNNSFNKVFEDKLISPLQTDGALLEKEARVLIELFIKALPKKRRKIFLLHYFEGLSTAKISIQLNISQKTVQNQITTATHALKFRLTHLFLWLFSLYSAFLR